MTVLVIISIFIGIYALLIVFERIKKLKIYEDRIGESICTFVRSLDYRKIDLSIVRATTEPFEMWWSMGEKKIPYRKNDNVEEFGCCDYDLEDAISEICKKTNRSIEFEENPMIGKVYTIEDVINFVNLQPKASTVS